MHGTVQRDMRLGVADPACVFFSMPAWTRKTR
jgi:hypothetical protein